MAFYLIFIFLMWVLLGGNRLPIRYSKLSKYFIACALILILTSIRFDVGFDYANYYRIILDEGGESYANEPLSALLMNIGNYLKFPPITFFLYSVLTYSIAFYAIYKNSEEYNYVLFCYICFFFLDTLGCVRQALGEAIVLYGFSAIKEKNLLKYAIICCIGALAHKSALIAFPVYFLYNIKSTQLAIVLIASIGALMSVVSQYVAESGLFGAAANRISEGTDSPVGGGLIQYVFPLIFIFTIWLYHVKKVKIDLRLVVIVLLGLILPFVIGAHYGMRVSHYYNVYLCFLIGHVMGICSKQLRTFIMGIFGLYFVIFIAVGWNKKRPTIAPYQTIFQIENIDKPKFR